MADADWRKIRLDYVRGRGTYRELAKKYGVSRTTLEQRAKREKWTEAKRQYQGKVVAKAQARAQEKDAKRLEQLQNAGTEMCGQLEKLMLDAQRELHTHVSSDGKAIESEAINDKKLLNITRSIETMSRAMRNLYDIQTAAQTEQMRLAREEMEIKQREQARRDRETEMKEKEAGDKGTAEIQITYGGVDIPEEYTE